MQALLADPEKMKEATDKYNAMVKAQQGTGAAATEAEGGGKGEASLEGKEPPAAAEGGAAAAAAVRLCCVDT